VLRLTVRPAKMAEPIEMPSELVTCVGHRIQVLDGNPTVGRGIPEDDVCLDSSSCRRAAIPLASDAEISPRAVDPIVWLLTRSNVT